mmetsp:Transcript_7107/g.11197  ORF Transcript_7107/g.11197 Transcript_7107/m.11197 type:complete len:137 (+) Transcript_7107:187-597(+)
MFGTLWQYAQPVLAGAALVSFLSFFTPFFLMNAVYNVQDLKKKYNAKWALVTGSSSGIGKAIAKRLCSQGLNVVLVALDDQHLKNTAGELKKELAPISHELCLKRQASDLTGYRSGTPIWKSGLSAPTWQRTATWR